MAAEEHPLCALGKERNERIVSIKSRRPLSLHLSEEALRSNVSMVDEFTPADLLKTPVNVQRENLQRTMNIGPRLRLSIPLSKSLEESCESKEEKIYLPAAENELLASVVSACLLYTSPSPRD